MNTKFWILHVSCKHPCFTEEHGNHIEDIINWAGLTGVKGTGVTETEKIKMVCDHLMKNGQLVIVVKLPETFSVDRGGSGEVAGDLLALANTQKQKMREELAHEILLLDSLNSDDSDAFRIYDDEVEKLAVILKKARDQMIRLCKDEPISDSHVCDDRGIICDVRVRGADRIRKELAERRITRDDIKKAVKRARSQHKTRYNNKKTDNHEKHRQDSPHDIHQSPV